MKGFVLNRKDNSAQIVLQACISFISLKGRASYSGLIHLVAAAPFILLCGCLRHSYIYKLSDYLKFLRIASTILAPLLVVALCVALTNPGPKL